MDTLRIIGRILLVALLAGLTSPAAAQGGRQLVASDVLQIKVVGQSDLDTQVRISNDGSINFPFLGRVQAAGLTEDALAERLKQGLARAGIVKRAQVLVTTAEAGVYYLYGYVNKPGQYPLMRQMSVQQALSAGGGISPLGSDWRLQIKRKMPNGQTMEKSATLDEEVQPNDTIVVNQRIF
jgi:protein involved in polysaccharide export with SLBB domain